MNRYLNKITLSCFFGTLPLLVAIAYTTPLLPHREKLPDEARCLADIDEVSIEAASLPFLLKDAKLTSDMILKKVKEVLETNGIAVSEKSGTPRLKLHAITVTEPQDQTKVAVIVFIDVIQKVKVLRLDEDLTLPTATVLGRTLTTRDQLGKATLLQSEQAAHMFLTFLRQANRDVMTDE